MARYEHLPIYEENWGSTIEFADDTRNQEA